MYKAVVLQWVVILVAAGLAGAWLGHRGMASVMLGGAAYALPNLLFVARLSMASAQGRANAATFFIGELWKVLATIVILVVAQRFCAMSWPAMLGGLFVALQANLFAFLLKS
jgi:ATP synthase protein I